MKSKLILIALVLALVGGGPVFAQGIPADAPPVYVLKAVLNLSEDQVNGIQELLEVRTVEIQSIAAEIHLLERQLGEIMAGDAPDPLEVGELVLNVRMLRQEIALQREHSQEDFRLLLTQQQLQRVGQINHIGLLNRAAQILGQLGLR